MTSLVKSPSSPTPKAKVWPSRSSLGTAKLVNTHDFEGARRIISVVSRQLFTQDGTVELMACHLNEKGMRIGTVAVILISNSKKFCANTLGFAKRNFK